MRTKHALLGLALVASSCSSTGDYQTVRNPDGRVGIAVDRPPADYGDLFRGKAEFPRFDPASNRMWQVDVRSADLTGFDLSGRYADVSNASFDTKTQWPSRLPPNFDPGVVLERGKDPGLGVRALHAQGITGQGIGLAIIDQGLLTNHVEYKDQLRFYEEIHCAQDTSMHGAAVASIAVGKTVGVAPGADLYYIAETHGTFVPGGFNEDLSYLASAIDRIVEVNKAVSQGAKIRVISISLGLDREATNGNLVRAAIQRAQDQGIFVVSVDSAGLGIGRLDTSDANDYAGLRPGRFWWSDFRAHPQAPSYTTLLKAPMDYRTTASPTGVSDYVYYPDGGMSWTVPYMAGLYALCCQVDPEITPARFQALARETAQTVEFDDAGSRYSLTLVVHPGKLVAKLKALTQP